MISRTTCVRWLVSVPALLILFVLTVYAVFPTQRIEYQLLRALEAQQLSLSPGLHKTILPGLRWEKPVLSTEQGALLRCEWLKLQPRFWPLLVGRGVLDVSAATGGGTLTAAYGINGKQALEIHAQGIGLGEIPFFKTVLGARAGGSLWSEGRLSRQAAGLSGELKLEVKQLELSGVKLGAFPLPDVTNLIAQGMLRVTDGKARMESFTLQGEGIYMRLSGDLPLGGPAAAAPLNLTLEIMPKPEFLDRQKLVFLLLAKFMVSPGVYRVPIRGTLLKPEIV